MSGPDVLAVMDRAAGGLFAARGMVPYDLMEARAAVEKLIADRAELLEALIELDERYCSVSDHMTKNDRQRHRLTLIKVRAAIARATGEGNE